MSRQRESRMISAIGGIAGCLLGFAVEAVGQTVRFSPGEDAPIALNLMETTRVVNVIRERGIPVQLGFMRRFDPGYARAKQKIEAGDLGRIELFRALSRDTYPPSLEFLLGSGENRPVKVSEIQA